MLKGCGFKKKYFRWRLATLTFFYLQPKLVITFKSSEFAIASDSPGSESGCDLVPHINTPICISSVFFVNSKQKLNHGQEKIHIISAKRKI